VIYSEEIIEKVKSTLKIVFIHQETGISDFGVVAKHC